MSFVVFYEKDENLFATSNIYSKHIPNVYLSHSQKLPMSYNLRMKSLGKAFAFPRRNQHYARPDV